MDGLTDWAVIRQQIALNTRMFEAGRIPKGLHDHAHGVLIDRLTKAGGCDSIIDN